MVGVAITVRSISCEPGQVSTTVLIGRVSMNLCVEAWRWRIFYWLESNVDNRVPVDVLFMRPMPKCLRQLGQVLKSMLRKSPRYIKTFLIT